MATLQVSVYGISLVCVISLISTAFAGVPVLIWESNSLSEKEDLVPALNQLDGDEFSNHLIKKVHTHKPLIAVFVEETLSVEDFSWRNDKRQGAFQKLLNITGMAAKREFIPSVIDPVAALKDLVDSQGYTYLKFDRTNAKAKPGTAFEIDLSDPYVSEDRPMLLRRHDSDVAQIYSDLLASAPRILAVFTGRQNSWVEAEANRVRRFVNDSMPAIDWTTTFAKITAKSAKLTANNKTYELGTPSGIQADERPNYFRMVYAYTTDDQTKITLRIRFDFDKNFWNIGETEVQVGSDTLEPISPKTKTSTKAGRSLRASEMILDNASGVTLAFTDFQAEKFKKANQLNFSATSTGGVVFFTGGIWMGLLVSWTLLIILGWGIMMLMDIKTMDRFDDPKGKTITVNVNE